MLRYVFRWSPLLIAATLAVIGPRPVSASFLPTQGWKDDVDLVVAPDGEFLVICESDTSGLSSRVTVVDLDPVTGAPIAMRFFRNVPGFENGVDPFIVNNLAPGAGYPVLVPVESEDGTLAGVYVLLVSAAGNLLFEKPIVLGNLGFREDVDGTWSQYLGTAVAYFGLESEDRSVSGVLAIDVDNRAAHGCAGIGCCNLLSSDGRGGLGVDHSVLTPGLPGLAFGVDPTSFEIGDANRLVLPVTDDARHGDILLMDFDPNDPFFPVFLRAFSVKAVNAGGPHPTPFPGFEADVDPLLFTGACGVGVNTLLVPVEGDDGEADVYLIDVSDAADGTALWKLSEWAGPLGLDILGFEMGVDLLPLCGLGGAHPNRLAVPLENANGTEVHPAASAS